MNLFRGRPKLDYGEAAELAHDENSTGSYLEPKDQFFIQLRPKSYFRSDASTVSSITYQDNNNVRSSGASTWCCGSSSQPVAVPQPRLEVKKMIPRTIPKDTANEWYGCNSCPTENEPAFNGSKDRRKSLEEDEDTIPTRETASLFDNLSSDDEDDEVQRIRGSPSRRRKWRLLRNISGKKKNRRRNDLNIQTEISP